MRSPPHPGEFIFSTYLEPYGMSIRALAEGLSVSPSTVSRIINGQSAVSPAMALRLTKAVGRSPESWLAMQYQCCNMITVYGELLMQLLKFKQR